MFLLYFAGIVGILTLSICTTLAVVFNRLEHYKSIRKTYYCDCCNKESR